jgi:hypothetical protein
MREGRLALKQGDPELAHDLWREAAMLNPYSEQVWLALLEVLDTLEDRRVCLQNIVEINPLNVQARRMLRAYEAREERLTGTARENRSTLAFVRRKQRGLVVRSLMLGLFVGLSGLFFAIVLSILIYAT